MTDDRDAVLEAGRYPHREAFLGGHPDLCPDLDRLIESVDAVQGVAAGGGG